MGVKTSAKVWDWSKSTCNHRLVMLALADFCDDHDECFPGVARIAKKCRISERTTQRCFRDLADMGELQVLEKLGMKTNGGATNRFRLILKGGDKSGVKGGDNPGIKVVTNTAKGGDTAMSPEPSVEPSVNHQRFASQTEVVEAKAKTRREVFEEFQTIWNTELKGILPEIKVYSEKRAMAHATRLMNPDWRTHWRAALEKIPSCPFLIGENDRKWKADAEFFLRPDTVAKIIEGKYDGPTVDPNDWWKKHY